MRRPGDKESKNGRGEPESYPSEMGFPGIYGRFGDQPDEEKLPQLSIMPGLIATILWVGIMIWLASLPGGPLHLPEKPTTTATSQALKD